MLDDSSAYTLDKSWVRRSFDRASATYDAAAVLQTEVRNLLLQRLELTDLSPRVAIDAGCGTGHAGRALKLRYPKAEVIALDSSLGMLRAARKQLAWRRPMWRLCADVERLPLADAAVDLILSNFMLPWTHAEETLREFRRVLAPHGLLTFTTLGPDTLQELRASWAEAGSRFNDAHSRVNLFLDMHDVGDALVRAGFAEPVLDVERYTLRYADVRALALDLKAMGGRNATRGRLKGLTGPRKFRAMQSAYEAFRVDGRLPATYEVVFGQAWTPAAARARAGTTAEIPVADLRRQLGERRRPGGAA
jgi:malonyl-CoA O-methyltransferase